MSARTDPPWTALAVLCLIVLVLLVVGLMAAVSGGETP